MVYYAFDFVLPLIIILMVKNEKFISIFMLVYSYYVICIVHGLYEKNCNLGEAEYFSALEESLD